MLKHATTRGLAWCWDSRRRQDRWRYVAAAWSRRRLSTLGLPQSRSCTHHTDDGNSPGHIIRQLHRVDRCRQLVPTFQRLVAAGLRTRCRWRSSTVCTVIVIVIVYLFIFYTTSESNLRVLRQRNLKKTNSNGTNDQTHDKAPPVRNQY